MINNKRAVQFPWKYLWPTVSQHTKIFPFEIASEELKGGRNIFR